MSFFFFKEITRTWFFQNFSLHNLSNGQNLWFFHPQKDLSLVIRTFYDCNPKAFIHFISVFTGWYRERRGKGGRLCLRLPFFWRSSRDKGSEMDYDRNYYLYGRQLLKHFWLIEKIQFSYFFKVKNQSIKFSKRMCKFWTFYQIFYRRRGRKYLSLAQFGSRGLWILITFRRTFIDSLKIFNSRLDHWVKHQEVFAENCLK